jgi:class 3 adenylate cyclase
MINHPLFVRAFPNERLHPDVVLNVGAVAIVAVQICDFDRLLNASGDVETLKRIREVRSAVARAFEAYGRHVKSADKWILGAFASPADAVLAGGNAFLAVTATQRDARAPIQIKCGVHVGPVAIATSDGAIDIFGKAVAMSQQVARSGDAFSLQVSDETAAAIPDLRSLLLDGSQSLRGAVPVSPLFVLSSALMRNAIPPKTKHCAMADIFISCAIDSRRRSPCPSHRLHTSTHMHKQPHHIASHRALSHWFLQEMLWHESN